MASSLVPDALRHSAGVAKCWETRGSLKSPRPDATLQPQKHADYDNASSSKSLLYVKINYQWKKICEKPLDLEKNK